MQNSSDLGHFKLKMPQKCITFEPKLRFTKFKGLNRSEFHQKLEFSSTFSIFNKKGGRGAYVHCTLCRPDSSSILEGDAKHFFHQSERGLHANLVIKRQHIYNLVINYIEDQQTKGQWVSNTYFVILLQVTLIIRLVSASQLNSRILLYDMICKKIFWHFSFIKCTQIISQTLKNQLIHAVKIAEVKQYARVLFG